ncbi:MAG: 30S ribosomal protein S20 [Bdellovibrionaceae bacterium]|nr:30S ribosomal protein S20 [Pseudobdellovibrionaceae bacterium]
MGVKEKTMANTRQAAKRVRRSNKNQNINNHHKGHVRHTLKLAVESLTTTEEKNVEVATAAYKAATKALAKAASKGAIPAGRASRKTARLTALAKKNFPEALPFKVKN